MGQSATKDVDAIIRVLGDAVAVLESADIVYLAIGSIAASVWGDVTWAREQADIDLFIKRADVPKALRLFDQAGYETKIPLEDDWLVKAYRDGVLVDLIFWAAREMEVDEEMIARGSMREVEGCPVRVAAPEDFVVMQALTVSRETPDHLFNGVSVVEHATIDWPYLLRRAAGHESRLLSLLTHAHSVGASVPRDVLRKLCACM